jgi:hypothetical protein
MALIIETVITCDVCGSSFGADNKTRTGMQQRTVARQYGWVYSQAADYCPNCRHRRNDGQYQKSHDRKSAAVQVYATAKS